MKSYRERFESAARRAERPSRWLYRVATDAIPTPRALLLMERAFVAGWVAGGPVYLFCEPKHRRAELTKRRAKARRVWRRKR